MATVILNPGRGMSYLAGLNVARKIGGTRMSNFLMDKCLIGPDAHKSMCGGVFPAGVGTALIYPEKNGVFQKGKDIVDPITGWRVASDVVEQLHISEQDAGRPGVINVIHVGIYASLENLEYNSNSVKATLSSKPEVVSAIYDFIQEPVQAGKVNELGVPVQTAEELLKNLPYAEKRLLARVDGAGFRFIVRANGVRPYNGLYDGPQTVDARSLPSENLGVPIEISLEKLVAQTNGAVVQLLNEAEKNANRVVINVKRTASGLIIASEEISMQIIDLIMKKPA